MVSRWSALGPGAQDYQEWARVHTRVLGRFGAGTGPVSKGIVATGWCWEEVGPIRLVPWGPEASGFLLRFGKLCFQTEVGSGVGLGSGNCCLAQLSPALPCAPTLRPLPGQREEQGPCVILGGRGLRGLLQGVHPERWAHLATGRRGIVLGCI